MFSDLIQGRQSKRVLPRIPEHIYQPEPCCHMYHCVGGCLEKATKPRDVIAEPKDEKTKAG